MCTDPSFIVNHTRAWLERVVVGLNLCPFAKAPMVKDQIRFVVSEARDLATLLEDLAHELRYLAQTDINSTETCLLIHPHVLQDFSDFNQALGAVDALLDALHLEGEFQVASFHPHYQFEGTEANDITNATNRAPYPTLHLLREASIDRAVAAIPDPGTIVEANLQTLEHLGHEGWAKLQAQCLRDAGGM